jgi:Tat protein translocase TatB subunit
MLGMGITEIIILAGIALVVMGPEKFPEVAKVFIRTIRDIRGYWEDAQRELAKEVNPLKKEIKELSRYKPEDYIDTLAGKDDKKKPGELDPDLNEPGASGYGAKVPDQAVPSSPDPNNPYGDPTPASPQPQPYAPPAPETAESAAATPASPSDDDEPLDNPPPRLEV